MAQIENSSRGTLYNGFTFQEIVDFENAALEVHSHCMKQYEETKDDEHMLIALDCLKAINDFEKVKAHLNID
ncbi:MAG: hypothetical protein ACFFG0_07115 [Candidatus Thorarchaeota archaeon]